MSTRRTAARARWTLALALLLVGPARGRGTAPAPPASGDAATAAAVAGLQNPDGGFAPRAGEGSTLGATNQAARVLGFVGASIRDPLKCVDFILSCRDAASGGFAPQPGGTPDVGTTASGLMALGELRAFPPEIVTAATAYLAANAKTYEEVRIAVAGFEAVGARPSPDLSACWSAVLEEGRGGDGLWGSGVTRAYDTGGRAAALLRMGLEPADRVAGGREALAAALKQGQQADGGWASKPDGPSDLGATYRVMRALYMLGAAPDLDALRSYFHARRTDSALYASAPGGAGELGATYTALILRKWARLLEGEEAFVETAGFRPLLDPKAPDGASPPGWEGETQYWAMRGGRLVGTSPGLDHNTFLVAPDRFRDFALKFSFRMKNGQGNSGVQFRSDPLPPHEMKGYQADIGEGFWGALYDESRRNRVLVQPSEEARAAIRPAGWNHYSLRAFGPDLSLTLNGQGAWSYHEDDPTIAPDGLIAVQLHAGGPMMMEFKDVLIQPVPTPAEDDALTPGFHLRKLNVNGEERKFTLYVPEGYDGSKAFPVVLFLHGAGERGTDGVSCARVGLGPAIQAHPGAHPYIGVFPQARETWRAGSPDAVAALAALDEVLATCKVDRARVTITGISMGGMGSWSIAAAEPDRFVAVAPVCGFEAVETALKLKQKPVWTLIGDADMPRLLDSTRAMARALRDAGGNLRYTEYRGVGHNSWDRAYSDPELVRWLVEPTK